MNYQTKYKQISNQDWQPKLLMAVSKLSSTVYPFSFLDVQRTGQPDRPASGLRSGYLIHGDINVPCLMTGLVLSGLECSPRLCRSAGRMLRIIRNDQKPLQRQQLRVCALLFVWCRVDGPHKYCTFTRVREELAQRSGHVLSF